MRSPEPSSTFACSSFLSQGLRHTLGEYWRGQGLAGLADLIKDISLPTFAEWRWAKMRACLHGLNDFI
eukprot:8688528-Pyramimonas_sp.AAC.1